MRLYRPQPKDGEDTVFTGVCLSTGGRGNPGKDRVHLCPPPSVARTEVTPVLVLNWGMRWGYPVLVLARETGWVLGYPGWGAGVHLPYELTNKLKI